MAIGAKSRSHGGIWSVLATFNRRVCLSISVAGSSFQCVQRNISRSCVVKRERLHRLCVVEHEQIQLLCVFSSFQRIIIIKSSFETLRGCQNVNANGNRVAESRGKKKTITVEQTKAIFSLNERRDELSIEWAMNDTSS